MAFALGLIEAINGTDAKLSPTNVMLVIAIMSNFLDIGEVDRAEPLLTLISSIVPPVGRQPALLPPSVFLV